MSLILFTFWYFCKFFVMSTLYFPLAVSSSIFLLSLRNSQRPEQQNPQGVVLWRSESNTKEMEARTHLPKNSSRMHPKLTNTRHFFSHEILIAQNFLKLLQFQLPEEVRREVQIINMQQAYKTTHLDWKCTGTGGSRGSISRKVWRS